MRRGIDVELIPGSRLMFRLLKPMCVWAVDRWHEVPARFLSDGPTIPRFFWRILPPFGTYLRWAILHDYLYRTGKYSRSVTDETLWDIAWKHDNTPLWQCWLIQAGLWLGAARAWKKYARMRKEGRLNVLTGDLLEHKP